MNPVLQWAVNQFRIGPEPASDTLILDSFHIAGLAESTQPKLCSNPLVSIFSQITLHPEGIIPDFQAKLLPDIPLTKSTVNYPVKEISTLSENTPSNIEISRAETNNNLALVFLEKYGSFRAISDNSRVNYYPFYDSVKSAAAIYDCLINGDSSNPFLLVSGDFSGIQKFVYTISSKGALKTLRARSFMLEMLTEHIVYEILTNGECSSQINVIYSGGGGFALLLPNMQTNLKVVTEIKKIINKWLIVEFVANLHISIEYIKLSKEGLKSNFGEMKNLLDDQVETDKKQKYFGQLKNILEPKMPLQLTNEDECQISHRDDVPENEMTYLGKEAEEKFSVSEHCSHLYWMGDELTSFDCIYRSDEPNSNYYLRFPGLNENAYYSVQRKDKNKIKAIWFKNNWDVYEYKSQNSFPFIFADYVRNVDSLPERAQKIEIATFEKEHLQEIRKEKVMASFTGLANAASGAGLIGALRMDVDNLGLIFSQGLGTDLNLITLSTISRNVNLFFKVCLNNICLGRLGLSENKALDVCEKKYVANKGRNVSVVYSGGDDLFIVGAWDEVTELAFDIQKCFKVYTCNNPDVGISGGITLHQSDYPLYQMVERAGEAESEAKSALFDCNKCEDTIHKIDNVSLCSRYVSRNGRCKKRKSNIAPFYNPAIKFRNDQINIQLRDEGSSERNKIKYVINWSDEDLLNLVNCLKKLSEVEKDQFGFVNRLKPRYISHAFLYKLFTVAERWQSEGAMYIPSLEYVMGNIKHKLQDKDKPYYNDLRDLLIAKPNHKNIRQFDIPLTWIELLYRDKGGD